MSLTTIPTPARYISPDHGKLTVSFPSTDSFNYCYSKQQSYFVRNHYHYEYIKKINGEAYFFTLTYNSKNLPRWFGVNVCDNRDLRWFIQDSGFRQRLFRDYGVRLGYFITTEFGEGKGVRGKGNNPHYHAIFYLWRDDFSPVSDVLTPTRFNVLVKRYWQGTGRRRPKDYIKGMAKCGQNHGLLESSAAISYVSKYCIKDQLIYDKYNLVKHNICQSLAKRLLNKIYFDDYYMSLDLVDLDSDSIIKRLDLLSCKHVKRAYNIFYRRFHRNVHSPKVFQSQGIGLYGVNFVDKSTCTIKIPDEKKVLKPVPLPLYLYRKVYMDVVKTPEGQNKYILNDDGIQYRLDSLLFKLDHVENEVRSLVNSYNYKSALNLISSYYPNLLDDKQWSDLLGFPRTFRFEKAAKFFFHYKREGVAPAFFDSILHRYSLYNMVYRDRICKDISIPLDLFEDYSTFLIPDFYEVQQDEFLFENLRYMQTYKHHPYFSPYLHYFAFLDLLTQCHADSCDKVKLDQSQSDRDHNRTIKSLQYNDNY